MSRAATVPCAPTTHLTAHTGTRMSCCATASVRAQHCHASSALPTRGRRRQCLPIAQLRTLPLSHQRQGVTLRCAMPEHSSTYHAQMAAAVLGGLPQCRIILARFFRCISSSAHPLVIASPFIPTLRHTLHHPCSLLQARRRRHKLSAADELCMRRMLNHDARHLDRFLCNPPACFVCSSLVSLRATAQPLFTLFTLAPTPPPRAPRHSGGLCRVIPRPSTRACPRRCILPHCARSCNRSHLMILTSCSQRRELCNSARCSREASSIHGRTEKTRTRPSSSSTDSALVPAASTAEAAAAPRRTPATAKATAPASAPAAVAKPTPSAARCATPGAEASAAARRSEAAPSASCCPATSAAALGT